MNQLIVYYKFYFNLPMTKKHVGNSNLMFICELIFTLGLYLMSYSPALTDSL